MFNVARNEYKIRVSEEWPNAGDVLTDRWGTAPLEPLRRAIEEHVVPGVEAPTFVRSAGAGVSQDELDAWAEHVSEKKGELIDGVSFVDADKTDRLSVYDLASRLVRVNRNHPFALEHQETAEQIRVLRNTAVADLLTDAFILNVGVSLEDSHDIAAFKDRALRLVAQVSRKSAAQIAQMLSEVTDRDKSLERIIGDALEYIGFVVKRLGGSGEPEGVAQAVVTPKADDTVVAYRFTYDAKSALRGVVQTGNVGVAGLVRHRKNHEADYTLVVGPRFQRGALDDECAEFKVTPMEAEDLAKLVMATAGSGPIDLDELRPIFECYTPSDTKAKVDRLVEEHTSLLHLSLDTLIRALEEFTTGDLIPDTLHAAQIADKCRALLGTSDYPKRGQVAAILRGLQLVIPKGLQVQGEDVFLSIHPRMLRRYLQKQLEQVPETLRFGLLKGTSE